MVILRTFRKDVLGEGSHVRGVELDWLRRLAIEIVGQQVSKLQARKRVGVDGLWLLSTQVVRMRSSSQRASFSPRT